MFKLSTISLRFFAVALALLLVACGDQPIKQEVDVPAEQKLSASKEALPVVAPKPKNEPEPPTIEIIPRKNLEDPMIAMEPLPADEPSADTVNPDIKGPEEKTVSTPDVVNPAEMPDTPKAAVKPVPAPEVKAPALPVESQLTPASEPVAEVDTQAPAPMVMPSDPDTYIVTVGPKAAPHPSLNKGHALGFLVNGVSGKQLVLERGKTYTFDIRTDPKHDVYISKKEIGWGSTPLAEGVTGDYTYKGKMTFSPTKSTPDNVYYACRNHPNMGALIQIVNPGEKAEAVKQSTMGSKAAAARSPGETVSASKVKQKLMFAEMMSTSKSAKRVNASQNDEAKEILKNAKALLAEGREKSLVGALPEALALADKSLKMMSEASRLVPGEEELVQMAESYKSSLAEIHDYQKSHKSNLKRIEKTGSVPEGAKYNEAEVSKKLSDAQTLADKKNYVRANAILGEVQKTITVALHRMLDSTTIVYDLNFETAADEYEYELKRFVGYEELIPVAIEAKKPAPGAIKLMESFHEKARKRRDQAVEKAAAGEYGDAIAMLQQATKTVRRALRMVGVTQ